MLESIMLLEFVVGFDISLEIEQQINTAERSRPMSLSPSQMAMVQRNEKWDLLLYSHMVSVFHQRLQDIRPIAAQVEY